MKKKIYIAGKVTGEQIGTCTMKFGSAQKELENAGFEAVNPLEVVGSFRITWKDAMRKCIKALVDCDAIYLLPCAKGSKGALIEKSIAIGLNMPYYDNVKSLEKELL